MRIKNKITLTFLFILLILSNACEQNTTNQLESSRIAYDVNVHEKQFGDYIIHINALTTDQLPAGVARAYNISRSKNRAMLNVSIRKKHAEEEIPVTAIVKVIAKNLISQQNNVEMREIKEPDSVAIYYIGELLVSNEEIITFKLDIMPEGTSKPFLLSYSQQFFTK
ncbi:MAG: DUF4426 domain-containing protein [Proteobacteria bacterium]|nr:DUF4426 domain-containing protein [Pseudomonadota bacterium]NOG59970.1 DUF4426 domain-containing protein [Pseudomonadota bacterium]